MAFSQRDLEGYLRIDHRDSPGFTAEETVGRTIPFVPQNTLFEAATLYCNHCQAIVVKNADRTRARAHCYGCDHFICDMCEAERVRTGVCRPFKKVIDEFMDRAQKGT